VRVTATLNFDQRQSEITTYKPDSSVPVRKSESTETFNGTGTPPGGIVGVEGSATTAATNGGTNQYNRTENAQENVVSTSVEKATKAGGTIDRLSAAAIVDKSLDPPPNVDQVKSLIGAAIGLSTERGDSIVVESVAFDEATKTAAAKDQSAAAATPVSASPLFNYIRIGVGALVLILVALFLRRGLKVTSESVAIPAGAMGRAPRPANRNDAANSDDDMITLPSELRLIDAQPDDLAVVLRSWVADRREVAR
jgi:flagellar M-ring protein FliF